MSYTNIPGPSLANIHSSEAFTLNTHKENTPWKMDGQGFVLTVILVLQISWRFSNCVSSLSGYLYLLVVKCIIFVLAVVVFVSASR